MIRAVLLLLLPAASLRAAPAPPQPESPAACEEGVAAGDPGTARACLRATALLEELRRLDMARASEFIARAEALRDLDELFRRPWDAEGANRLSAALELRLDRGGPLAGLGIGPEPEKLRPWLLAHRPGLFPELGPVLARALREWDVVFGSASASVRVNWDQARDRPGAKEAVTVTRAAWEGWTLRERNAVVEKLSRYSHYSGFSDRASAAEAKLQELQNAVDAVRASGSLTPGQLAAMEGRSLQVQAYLLGSFFDGGAAVPPELRRKIDSARDSLPSEVLSSEQRSLLGGMLRSSLLREVKGTAAGDKVAVFYSRNAAAVKVEPCGGCYARYDPAARAIVLDSELIQQFLRLRGARAGDLLRDPAALADLSRYLSPVFVHEAAHHMQADWAAKGGFYKPRTQEDEVEASSLEALYTLEKLRVDGSFRALFADLRGVSPYAAKRLDTATAFREQGSRRFSDLMRLNYYHDVPSLSSASARVLGAIAAELSRRSALPPAARAELEALGLGTAEALSMEADELASSAGELTTAALEKIRSDLSDPAHYESHYRQEEKWGRSVKYGRGPAPPAVPLPGEGS